MVAVFISMAGRRRGLGPVEIKCGRCGIILGDTNTIGTRVWKAYAKQDRGGAYICGSKQDGGGVNGLAACNQRKLSATLDVCCLPSPRHHR